VAVSVVALNTILKAILGPTLLLILGIGPFRVVDGAHWPSDVLAGYALGLARSITVLVVGLPAARQPDQPPPTGRRKRSIKGEPKSPIAPAATSGSW
jgi:membrane-associated phospholipid phosphatase